ncbi:MAG: M20/M25/M40 family metallo-hydrolase [Gemmatimonadota bacterium]
MTVRGLARALVLVAVAAARPGEAAAQDGFAAGTGEGQAAFERALVSAVEADSVARWARALAARSHVAGTPGQAATRDSVVAWHRAAGIEVAYDSLVIYLPQPLEVTLEQSAPVARAFELDEPPLFEREYSHVAAFNAFSGNGEASGRVVYANYGLPEDYAVLDSLGIGVAGRIVLARYGRSFRGIKAREAEARGAAGLLMFSDPSADGFARGAVLPEGPQRPPRGVQRGSVLNADGDPSTPGRPSLPGADRVPEGEMEGVARIPVLPIGYGTAEELLRTLDGPPPPDGWRGALDVGYRPGPGPTRVRMRVRTEEGDDAYHAAFNTIAVIPGSVWPDEWVLVGAHRDSWGPGAVDNVSGTAAVVEAARAFSVAAEQGYRPRRSLVFLTWDAEEWGILGSTEWVEANVDRLRKSVVAYLNQDSPVSGERFGASAAPEIRELVRDATRAVRHPAAGRSVYDVWLERQREGRDAAGVERPAVGTMGGGSDHLPFYIHLGIPVAGWGFGGQGGVYHSMYDTSEWMERFGDPGYAFHAATARLTAVILARLANAEVLPYGHETLASAFRTEIAGFVTELDRSEVPVDSLLTARLAEVRDALEGYETAAHDFEVAVAARLDHGAPDPDTAARINAGQREVLQALLRSADEAGWSRNLYVRDDPDNGYSPLVLPDLRLALRAEDSAGVAAALAALSAHFGDAGRSLRAATRLVESGQTGVRR